MNEAKSLVLKRYPRAICDHRNVLVGYAIYTVLPRLGGHRLTHWLKNEQAAWETAAAKIFADALTR